MQEQQFQKTHLDRIYDLAWDALAGAATREQMLLERHSSDWSVFRTSGELPDNHCQLNGSHLDGLPLDDDTHPAPGGYSQLKGKRKCFIRKFSQAGIQYACVVELPAKESSLIPHWSTVVGLARECQRNALLGNTDHATGIGNRRAFEEWLARVEAPVLIFCDLDDFKRYNDRDWTIGDKVLLRAASLLGGYAANRLGPPKSSCFTSGAAFRWGGDEFVIGCETAPDVDSGTVLAEVHEHAHNILRELGRRWGIVNALELPRGIPLSLGIYVHQRGTAMPSERTDMSAWASHAARAAKGMGKGQFANWSDVQPVRELEIEILERQGRMVLIDKGLESKLTRDMVFDVLWTTPKGMPAIDYVKGKIRADDVRELSVCEIIEERVPVAAKDRVRLH